MWKCWCCGIELPTRWHTRCNACLEFRVAAAAPPPSKAERVRSRSVTRQFCHDLRRTGQSIDGRDNMNNATVDVCYVQVRWRSQGFSFSPDQVSAAYTNGIDARTLLPRAVQSSESKIYTVLLGEVSHSEATLEVIFIFIHPHPLISHHNFPGFTLLDNT